MQKLYKALKILILIVLSSVVLLIASSEFLEDKVAAISINQINKSVGLPASYGEISFSLIRDFPLATLEINNIWLGSPRNDSTGSVIDTLATIDKLYVAVKLIPLIRERHFDIVEVDVIDASAFYTMNADSTSNIDFLLNDETKVETVDTSSTSLNISLEKLSIKNLALYYLDIRSNIKAHLKIPRIGMNGELADEAFKGAITGEAVLSDCNYGNTNLREMERTQIDFDLQYADKKAHCNEAFIESDGINMSITGMVDFSDRVNTDLQVDVPLVEIEELIKYVPADLLYEYGIAEASGTINLNGTIKGSITDSVMPDIAIDFGLKEGAARIENHPPLKKLSTKGQFENGNFGNTRSTRIALDKLNFETGKSNGSIDIVFQDTRKTEYSVNLEFNGDLDELNTYYFPDTLIENISGRLNARLSTSGELPETIDSTFIDYLSQTTSGTISLRDVNLKMDSTISVDSCSLNLEYSPNFLSLEQVKFELPGYKLKVKEAYFRVIPGGMLSNYNDMSVQIDSSFVKTKRSKLELSGMLSNLHSPDYQLHAKLDLDLPEIKEMLPDTLVHDLRGHINAKLASSGTIRPDSISKDMGRLIFENSSYSALFNNLTLEMPDTLLQVKNLSGQMNMGTDTISIYNTYGNYKGIHFSADSTYIINYNESLIKNKPSKLIVEGDFGLGDINYKMLGAFMDADTIEQPDVAVSETNSTPSGANFSYQVKGSLAVNSIHYNQSTIDNISCLFNISDSLYIIDKLQFNAFSGHLNNSLRYQLRPNNRSVISFRSKVKQMDISRLLREFDNFDQEELTHEQLSGLFSTTMNGRFLMSGDSLVMDSTKLKGDLMLEDGGLFNYKRAVEMAEFINIEELDNLRFKTMESKIFIFNNAMYVPKTEIKSNALNIGAYGMQTFGDDYQYHFRLYLGEVLSGKTRRIRRKQQAIEDNPDKESSGLRSLYVQASSINGESRNGLDNKSDRSRMETKINVQESILNIIFHPLLVDFETGVAPWKANRNNLKAASQDSENR